MSVLQIKQKNFIKVHQLAERVDKNGKKYFVPHENAKDVLNTHKVSKVLKNTKAFIRHRNRMDKIKGIKRVLTFAELNKNALIASDNKLA